MIDPNCDSEPDPSSRSHEDKPCFTEQAKERSIRESISASYCGYSTELPVFDGSKWEWENCRELYLTDQGVEQWKTHFFNVEGWNPDTGYPRRRTLEDLGMKQVADVLQSHNRLG